MIENGDAPGPALSPDSLYALLPAAFRTVDAHQGHALLALNAVFEAVRGDIAAAITTLEDGWFAETCPDAFLPVLARLFGCDLGAQPLPEHRALVADQLGARRRKGLAAALPRLIYGHSGWRSLHASSATTPPQAWPLPTASVPADGCHGLLRVWRRPVFAMRGVSPARLGDRSFALHPAGLPVSLSNLPNTALEWSACPPVTALPARLTSAMLAADLIQWRRDWPGGDGPSNSLLYGPARGLAITVRELADGPWRTLSPGEVFAGAGGAGPVAPDWPVLRGGVLDTAGLAAGVERLTLTFGDATAELTIAVPARADLPRLVAAVEDALATAVVIGGSLVTEADVRAIAVAAAGSQLVLIPTRALDQPLALAPAGDGADPLALAGSARIGIAAATLPLDAAALAAFVAGPTQELRFTTPGGQVFAAALPLALSSPTLPDVAAAFAAAAPAFAVLDVGDRIVFVPPIGPPPTEPPAATPLATALGLTARIVLDCERGRVVWSSALVLPTAITVDYAVAAPSGIGGLSADPPPLADTIDDTGDPGAASRMLESAAGGSLMLRGGATRTVPGQTISGSWTFVGAAGARPYLAIGPSEALTLDGHDAALTLANLLVGGTILLGSGTPQLDLAELTLLPPDQSAVAIGPATGASSPPGTVHITAARTIVGPIDAIGSGGGVTLADTVVSALPRPDSGRDVLSTALGCALRCDRVTIIGGIAAAGPAAMRDSIVAGTLRCDDDIAIADSAVAGLRMPGGALPPAGSSAAVSWCATCGKAASVALGPVRIGRLEIDKAMLCSCSTPAPSIPRDCAGCAGDCGSCPLRGPDSDWASLTGASLISTAAYPDPDFATLATDADPTVRTAAGNRDEPGALNAALPTARAAGFERALTEGLLAGVRPIVSYED